MNKYRNKTRIKMINREIAQLCMHIKWNYSNDLMAARATHLKLFLFTSSLMGRLFHVTIVLG